MGVEGEEVARVGGDVSRGESIEDDVLGGRGGDSRGEAVGLSKKGERRGREGG